MTLKFLLILGLVPLALAAVTHNVSELNSHFAKFEKDFGKKYRNIEERSKRFINFVKNFQDMEEHNQVNFK
jgi:ribosomal protein S15P/S13E